MTSGQHGGAERCSGDPGGHGRANAAMMERAGLAVICPGVRELRSTVAELVADRGRLARMRAAEPAHLQGRDLCDDLAPLATASPLDAARAVHGVAAAVRRRGLRALTLAETDRPGRHRFRTAA